MTSFGFIKGKTRQGWDKINQMRSERKEKKIWVFIGGGGELSEDASCERRLVVKNYGLDSEGPQRKGDTTVAPPREIVPIVEIEVRK